MLLSRISSAARRHLAPLSIVTSIAMAALKVRVAGSSGSLALYGSALDEVFDVVIIGLTMVVARRAAALGHSPADRVRRERDERHGALLQAPFLLLAGGVVLHMAAGQLTGGAMTMRMHAAPLALATLLVSGVADGWRAVALTRAARRAPSPTVAAAALNFRLDVLTTVVAIVGLTTVGTGYQIADPIAALLIGLVMLASAVRLTWHTLRARPATA